MNRVIGDPQLFRFKVKGDNMNKKNALIVMAVALALMLIGDILPFADLVGIKISLFGIATVLWLLLGVAAIIFLYFGKGTLALVFGLLSAGGQFLSFFVNMSDANKLGLDKGIGFWIVLLSAIVMLVAAIMAFLGSKTAAAAE